MKILFVSNLYPPNHLGGWEMLCHEVATEMQARGHHVTILTSTFGQPVPDEPDVIRRLRLETDIYYYRPQQVLRFWSDTRANRQVVDEAFAAIKPDIVVIWGLWNVSRQVAIWAEEHAGSKVVYYLAGTWPIEPSAHEAYWDGPANSVGGKIFKRILHAPIRAALRTEWRPYRLRYEHAIVCSKALRDDIVRGGVPIQNAQIIYHGIDADLYRLAAQKRTPDSTGALRVVFVGSVLPQKGVHTAVEALGLLANDPKSTPMTLHILGKGHPEYEQRLRAMVQQYRIEDRVTFHAPIPRSELADFLARFDALVLPSTWEEPQARISQEAMASGLVLVGTLTGGTKEILIDEQNGLAFEKEDAQGLARQLQRLAIDPELRAKLTHAAWQTVSEGFTISHMIDQMESYLADVAAK